MEDGGWRMEDGGWRMEDGRIGITRVNGQGSCVAQNRNPITDELIQSISITLESPTHSSPSPHL